MKAYFNKFVKFRERENQPRKDKQTRVTDFFKDPRADDHNIEVLRGTTGKIPCFQVNNRRRLMSCVNITNLTANLTSFIVLGQEPSCFGHNVTGYSRGRFWGGSECKKHSVR